jgi:hypothetical protein
MRIKWKSYIRFVFKQLSYLRLKQECIYIKWLLQKFSRLNWSDSRPSLFVIYVSISGNPWFCTIWLSVYTYSLNLLCRKIWQKTSRTVWLADWIDSLTVQTDSLTQDRLIPWQMFTAVTIKIVALFYLTPCSLIHDYKTLRGKYYLQLQRREKQQLRPRSL